MSTIAIEIPREELRAFCRKWKVTELSLVGSATRPEEFRADSDVDVLVSFAADAEWSRQRAILSSAVPLDLA